MRRYEIFDSYYYGIIGTIGIIGLTLILITVWIGYNILEELRRQNYIIQENHKKIKKNKDE